MPLQAVACDVGGSLIPRLGCWFSSLLVFLSLAFAHEAAAQGSHSIIDSKHDLSVSGPWDVRAATEKETCIFCHAPHNTTGQQPLWNHEMSVATYTPYSSSTLRATVGQPTGASKLCLSCHDGTVALGMVASRPTPIAMRSGVSTMPIGVTRFGTDLSAHHPISFVYDQALVAANPELRSPDTLPPEVRLDKNQELQCTACHDPHSDQYGKFLVKDNVASALCRDCHVPDGWDTSSHATSVATWGGSGIDPWPHTEQTTVAANACENCHRPHDAGTKAQLLNFANEEQNCNSCHSGTVAAKNVAAEFNKASIHPLTLTAGVHSPTEDPINPPRHVECADCHNPHATRNATATAPAVSGALAGVKGVNVNGGVVQSAQFEYEVCFRCHGDSLNRGPARVTRQNVQTNTRLEFSPANTSYHPVIAAGKNTILPSLISPWSASSVMYCGDCHNNNQGPGAGGSSANPKGPHGSDFPPILERQLLLTDLTAYNQQNSALCFKCHSSAVVVSSRTDSWEFHQKHIVDFKAACTTCHDSHGSSQPHLINFNTTYVKSYNGLIQYNSTGPNHGNCTLSCHDGDGVNKNHTPKSY